MDTLFESDAAAPDPDPSRGPGRGVGQGPAGSDDRPLAARMRPGTLADFVGQSHLLGTDSALRTAIEQGRPHSMILYGPPGTGKTTLARMVAEHSNAVFEELSAVQAGRAEVRAVLERAAHRRRMSSPPTPGAGGVQRVGGTHTVFFLDEIHRFNKAQQDALLPAVEDGLVTLIGATTENPAFEVNGALLSRTRVYALKALSDKEVGTVLRRAVAARDGRGRDDEASEQDDPASERDGAETAAEIEVDDGALDFLAARSVGDARTALNALELALATAAELGERKVTIARAEDALQQRAVLYDKGGDRHYDYISAWIKATRGSDPDASLYYLAVMLEGGEDPRFIVRRMVILASEDIGNADPQALSVAVSAAQAVEHVGLPEATYALAQAAIYLALAPKSNAAGRALGAARAHVREHGAAPVPGWLRSGPRPGQEVGGYDNPHGHPGHLAAQELLPEGVAGKRFYEPDEAEAELARRLEQIRRSRGR
jgi:putative ATPase